MAAMSESEIINRLEFPPLAVVQVTEQAKAQNFRLDAILEMEWQGAREKFLAEVKLRSTPSVLRGAVEQLRHYQEALSSANPTEKLWPLVIVPYLGPEALERLSAAGVSGIDLCGNGVINIPGHWFVYRTGNKNRFPSSAPIKNVFTGVSSLVARVFLLQPAFPSVGAVLEETVRRGGGTTLATVSKVLKALEEELIITRGESIRLADAPRLLRLLEKNYRPPQIRRRRSIKVADLNSTLAQLRENAATLGLPLAANVPARYTLLPAVEAMQIYAPSSEKLLNGVAYTETRRFPDIELCETKDPTVYFDCREEDGFFWVSPWQVYLELSQGGKREQESAELLRDALLQGLTGSKDGRN